MATREPIAAIEPMPASEQISDLDSLVQHSAREWSGRAWRAVEAQHVIVTARLTDSDAEQALLESLIDDAKPPITAKSSGLHWLLFTPFRYPPLPGGSRFRAAGNPGVWYGADARATACAELGYWRWRFLMMSPALSHLPAQPQTLFQAQIKARTVDLTRGRLASSRAQWTNPNDYSACQSVARLSRAKSAAVIRYESVRDPEHRTCVAVLDWRAFERKRPTLSETWLLAVDRERVVWAATDPLAPARLEFMPAGWRAERSA